MQFFSTAPSQQATDPSGNTQMLQCGIFHRLQHEWVFAPQAAMEHMLHHGPFHVLHGNTYSGACSTPLPVFLISLLPVLFLTPPSACPAFLHFLNHAFPAAPWAQLLCPPSAWCGSVAELPEPCTGNPHKLLTDATLQPSPATKLLPRKPKIPGLSGLEVSDLRIFWF